MPCTPCPAGKVSRTDGEGTAAYQKLERLDRSGRSGRGRIEPVRKERERAERGRERQREKGRSAGGYSLKATSMSLTSSGLMVTISPISRE